MPFFDKCCHKNQKILWWRRAKKGCKKYFSKLLSCWLCLNVFKKSTTCLIHWWQSLFLKLKICKRNRQVKRYFFFTISLSKKSWLVLKQPMSSGKKNHCLQRNQKKPKQTYKKNTRFEKTFLTKSCHILFDLSEKFWKMMIVIFY